MSTLAATNLKHASSASNNIVLDSSGNTAISGVLTATAGTSGAPSITTNGDTNTGVFFPAADTVAVGTGGTERMRITTGGEFLVGVTTGNGPAGTIGSKGYQSRSGSAGGFSGNVFNIYWTGAAAQLWIDTTNVGNITLSSDYRIKRNVGTQDQPALARVLQLRPVTYQMADYGNIIKSSDDVLEGFIAHELAEVIPSAVNGVKDATDQLQSLKLDALCSVLVKAIQELKAEFDAYKATHP